MSPIQQMLLGVGAKADPIYVDQVFNNYVYTGSSSAQTFDVGVDLANEGGLIWSKYRTMNSTGIIFDTERGKTKILKTTSTDGNATSSTAITSFNNNGFSVGGGDGWTNFNSNHTFATWIWRKAPGFCDIVEYTGNSTNREIAHSLGTNVGMMIIKGTFTWGASSWFVWHRDFGDTNTDQYNYRVRLSHTNARDSGYSGIWYQNPTSTHFSVGSNGALNTDGASYICYLFAGGESTAATARSVDFGSSNYISQPSNSDFNGIQAQAFTVEYWMNADAFSSSANGGSSVLGVSNPTTTSEYWSFGTKSTGEVIFYYYNGSVVIETTGVTLTKGQWYHLALVHDGSNGFKIFVNGLLVKSGTISGSITPTGTPFSIGRVSNGQFDGRISNVRVVHSAVYTSSFKPSTEPLTNITNTKLLCCNNSSVTGSTVTPGTITATNSPTASTASPFDDPAGFVFGDSQEGVIKCGSYVGTGSAGLAVNIGWEPQFLMIKRIDSSGAWYMYDSIRGVVTGGDDANLRANDSQVEADADHIEFTPTGFNLISTSSGVNSDGGKWLYIAVRRPDGYVGKPPSLGTGVFAMDTGNSSATIPTFDSGFPVDFMIRKNYNANVQWTSGARLTGLSRLAPNETYVEVSDSTVTWDSNVGWGSTEQGTALISHMWKRSAGFDCIAYQGDGSPNRSIPHNLSKSAEMIWTKSRSATEPWHVWHKGLNGGGNNAIERFLRLNTYDSVMQDTGGYKTIPTSTHYTIGSSDPYNKNGDNYIAMLFASVDGISSIGGYAGSDTSNVTVNCGFQPRFIIIKEQDATRQWVVFDTVRGIQSPGVDQQLYLSATYTQDNDFDYLDISSTGFTVKTNSTNVNQGSQNYIYYAHS